jgi:hypothetical protein
MELLDKVASKINLSNKGIKVVLVQSKHTTDISYLVSSIHASVFSKLKPLTLSTRYK